MSSVCDGLITGSIRPSCDDPIVGGMKDRALIINKKEIDQSATVVNGSILKTLKLLTGKKAFEIEVPGNSPFTGTMTNLTEGTLINSWSREFKFIVLEHSPEIVESILNPLIRGEFLVIFENSYINRNSATNPGASRYEVYGFHQGLKATASERNIYSEDTLGGWDITLSEQRAPAAGLFFFDTDITTTEAAFKNLLLPAT